jgi:predicted CXXCH cytochrome family protein
LIYIATQRSGAKLQHEKVVEVDALTVGRATDNVVQIHGLTIAYEHATFLAEAGGIVVASRGDAVLTVNGRRVPRSGVVVGDKVRIGTYELEVLEPKDDEQLAVKIEEITPAAADARADAPGATSARSASGKIPGVEQGLFTRRKLFWLLVACCAASILAPTLYSRYAKQSLWQQPAGRLLEGQLSVGVLSKPHANVACEACHEKHDGWRKVTDGACLASGCHASVGAHVVPNALVADTQSSEMPGVTAWRAVSALPESRCQHCHLEHEGNDALLQRGDRLCLTCHADMKAKLGPALADAQFTGDGRNDGRISSFVAGHPQFRPSIVAEVHADGKERFRRTPIGAADTSESKSGLKFSHKVHLKRIRGFDGEDQTTRLECASCHTLSSTGEMMTKATFAHDCQPCHWHKLTIAEVAGGREVPHAEPELVRHALIEFYSNLVLNGRSEDPGIANAGVRRPGTSSSSQDCRGTPREVAECTAAVAIARWFDADKAPGEETKGPCFTCHVQTGDAGAASCQVPGVAEVRLLPLVPERPSQPDRRRELPLDAGCERMRISAGQRWLPFAKFNHAAHAGLRYPAPSSAKLTCEGCHRAKGADAATVVLLPPIEKCRQCHGGEQPAANRTASSCLMCHEFHHSDFGPMRCQSAPESTTPIADEKAS